MRALRLVFDGALKFFKSLVIFFIDYGIAFLEKNRFRWLGYRPTQYQACFERAINFTYLKNTSFNVFLAASVIMKTIDRRILPFCARYVSQLSCIAAQWRT